MKQQFFTHKYSNMCQSCIGQHAHRWVGLVVGRVDNQLNHNFDSITMITQHPDGEEFGAEFIEDLVACDEQGVPI